MIRYFVASHNYKYMNIQLFFENNKSIDVRGQIKKYKAVKSKIRKSQRGIYCTRKLK